MEALRVSSNPSYERLPTSFYNATPAETNNNNVNWADSNSTEFENLSVSQKVASLLFVAATVFVLIVGLFAILDFSMSRTINQSNAQIIAMHGIHLQSMVIYNLQSMNSTFIAGCNVTFNVTNKRDVEYFYDKGVIWVIFDEKIMWTLPTTEFYQAIGETTLVNASASPAKMETDLYVPRALASDRKLHEWETFKVRFDIYYRGGVGRNGFNLGGLKYVCNVNMTFRDETTLVGGPSACIASVQDITNCDNLFFCNSN